MLMEIISFYIQLFLGPDKYSTSDFRRTVERPLFALNCGIMFFYFFRYQPKYDHFCNFQE